MATTVEPAQATAPTNPTPDPTSTPTIALTIFFYGGLDLLFSGAHTLSVHLPASSATSADPPQATVGDTIQHMANTYLANSSKKELFTKDGTVTPGILVLVNDADWELEGKEECVLKEGDEVVFVSTLHGG